VEKDLVVQKLSSEKFTTVFSSPLTRCRQLALAISRGVPVKFDARLMELNFGTWEGQNWNDIHRTYAANKWFRNWVQTPCPAGESYQQLLNRVEDFINHIQPVCNNHSVLLVTHAGVIRALICLLNSYEPKRAFEINIDFGGLLTFEF